MRRLQSRVQRLEDFVPKGPPRRFSIVFVEHGETRAQAVERREQETREKLPADANVMFVKLVKAGPEGGIASGYVDF